MEDENKGRDEEIEEEETDLIFVQMICNIPTHLGCSAVLDGVIVVVVIYRQKAVIIVIWNDGHIRESLNVNLYTIGGCPPGEYETLFCFENSVFDFNVIVIINNARVQTDIEETTLSNRLFLPCAIFH